MANRISWFELVSTPLVTTNTSMDRYDNYWAVIQGGAVSATISSTDNRLKFLKLLVPANPGTLTDLEKKYYEGTAFGVNAAKFTLSDLRTFTANGEALPAVVPHPPFFT
jgi:hypothetical protein